MKGTVRVGSLVWFATGVVVTLLATVIVMQTWQADAAPGESDSTLVPITPCRLVDTRQPGQPPLGAGETRTITAHGTNGPIPGSQCSIPADAVGLSMNVTALDATAVTFWTISPTGVPRPEASSLNPAPGQPPTPNAVTTPISTAGQFDVFNFAGTAGMLIDVNGYYTGASLSELASRLAAVEADVGANTSSIDGLDQRRPFAVHTVAETSAAVTETAESVLSVTVTAPTDGHVTVNSTANAFELFAGTVRCSITVAATPAALDDDFVQQWQSSAVDDGGVAQLAGTRVFDIAANETATYDLVCDRDGPPGSAAVDRMVLTAIFTPRP